MFRVYYKGVIRTVYKVIIQDGKTYFLFYHNGKWLWTLARNTRPVEESVHHG